MCVDTSVQLNRVNGPDISYIFREAVRRGEALVLVLVKVLVLVVGRR